MVNKKVFKLTAIVACLALSIISAYSQGQRLVVQFDELERDFLLIGDYVGEKFVIQDTIPHLGNSKYEVVLKKELDGLFLVTSLMDKLAVQLILHPDEKILELHVKRDDVRHPVYPRGSVNEEFLEYVEMSSEAARSQKKLRGMMQGLEDDTVEIRSLEKEFQKINEDVRSQRQKLQKKHEGDFLATLLASQTKLDIPEFSGEDQQVLYKRYRYRLDHYFDEVRNDPRFFRTKYFDGMVNNYVNEYTLKNRDSTYKSIAHVLDMIEDSEKVFESYFAKWVNKYSESTVMGEEKLFVRLILDYVAQDRTAFIPEKTGQKLKRIANVQNRCLIGNTAVDLKMPTLNIDSTAKLDSTDHANKKYYFLDDKASILEQTDSLLILFFWKSSCGHCKSAFPILVDVFKKYRDRGLNVLAINVGNYKHYNEAARFIQKHKGEEMVHMVDPYYRSKYAESYHVKQTPAIFILDRNKEILINRMGVTQIKTMIEGLADKHLAKAE